MAIQNIFTICFCLVIDTLMKLDNIKSNTNYNFGFYFLRMFMKQKKLLCKKNFKTWIF